MNGENEYPESRSMIEKGVEWDYEYDNGKETLQTTGPLRHGILIMVTGWNWKKTEHEIVFDKRIHAFEMTQMGLKMGFLISPADETTGR